MEKDTTQPADPPEATEGQPQETQAGAAQDMSVEERVKKAEEDTRRYLDNWRRAEADLQNFKRRAEQERAESNRYAGTSLIINLLPIVDDFERAFQSLDAHIAGMTWFDGVHLIYRKLIALLESAGVKPIKADGETFDPRFHEAVAHAEGEENKVISEVQRGYLLHDRVLRPAMVVVGKGEGEDKKEAAETDEGAPTS
jgi:molecular chaperone GrpE